jgi:hypothetical protein
VPARKEDLRLSQDVEELRPVTRERPSNLWALSPALLTIAIVIVGDLFKRDYSRDANDFGVVLVWILLCSHPALAIILWNRPREVRWVSMVSSAFFGLCSLFASLASLIKIGGVGL